MSEEKCETCRFWTDDSGGEDGGKCRRYPPGTLGDLIRVGLLDIYEAVKGTKRGDTPRMTTFDVSNDSQGAYGRQPRTIPDDWCGEYQPTPNVGRPPGET